MGCRGAGRGRGRVVGGRGFHVGFGVGEAWGLEEFGAQDDLGAAEAFAVAGRPQAVVAHDVRVGRGDVFA